VAFFFLAGSLGVQRGNDFGLGVNTAEEAGDGDKDGGGGPRRCRRHQGHRRLVGWQIAADGGVVLS
jgi:hypothetical protein